MAAILTWDEPCEASCGSQGFPIFPLKLPTRSSTTRLSSSSGSAGVLSLGVIPNSGRRAKKCVSGVSTLTPSSRCLGLRGLGLLNAEWVVSPWCTFLENGSEPRESRLRERYAQHRPLPSERHESPSP